MWSGSITFRIDKVFDKSSHSFPYHKMLLKHLQNLLKTMVSDLATFILASDRGDESSLESSDKYDSELRIFVIFLLSVNFFKYTIS